jgi:hypothetical protein
VREEEEGGEQHFGEEVRWRGMTRETKLWKGIVMIYEGEHDIHGEAPFCRPREFARISRI